MAAARVWRRAGVGHGVPRRAQRGVGCSSRRWPAGSASQRRRSGRRAQEVVQVPAPLLA
uniref:Uncharacterized protein n=1 Tax=Arundo donax TaxID=35708 RepID=A0A0A8YAX2_ARUDO